MAFNSTLLEKINSTYFGLLKGVNSASLGVNISIGKVFLSAAPYLTECTATVSDGITSYQVDVIGGEFPIYHIYNGLTAANFTVTVSYGVLGAAVNITAGAFDVYDFNLTDVSALWPDVRVTNQLPYTLTNFQISNAVLADISQNDPTLPDYPITFAPGSYISNETNFQYGYSHDTVWMAADVSYTIDLTAEGFGTRAISEHIFMPYKL